MQLRAVRSLAISMQRLALLVVRASTCTVQVNMQYRPSTTIASTIASGEGDCSIIIIIRTNRRVGLVIYCACVYFGCYAERAFL